LIDDLDCGQTPAGAAELWLLEPREPFNTRPVDYDEIDPPMRELVRLLNAWDLVTIGCCGGHAIVKNGSQAPKDEWWVTFMPRPADSTAPVFAPSATAWLNLEFLAYYLNHLEGAELVPSLRHRG
jgi:hypothetical protein